MIGKSSGTIRRQWFSTGKLLILVAFAVFFGAMTAGQGGDWEVARADYGWGARRVDVTDIVRRLLWEAKETGRAPVNNQVMGGDPFVGADKVLRIFAQNRRGDHREFDYKEGSWIDVTIFALRDDHRDRDDADRRNRDNDHDRDRGRDEDLRLTITRAYYGAPGRMANVTDILRHFQHGRLDVHVDNNSMGGDPATGADKVLFVVYEVRGQEIATYVGEGGVLRLP